MENSLATVACSIHRCVTMEDLASGVDALRRREIALLVIDCIELLESDSGIRNEALSQAVRRRLRGMLNLLNDCTDPKS